MILHTATIVKVDYHNDYRDVILRTMREKVGTDAIRRDLDLGVEVLETIYIRHNGKAWVTAKPENATHVKISLEVEGEPL